MGIDQVEFVKVRVLPDGRVSRADAAAFLGRSPKTLAEWHCKGLGPRAIKTGGRQFYRIEDLKAFVATGARQAA